MARTGEVVVGEYHPLWLASGPAGVHHNGNVIGTGRARLPRHHANISFYDHLLKSDTLDPLWHFSWVDRLAREVLHHNYVLDTGNLVTILVQDRTELSKGLIGAYDR